MANILVTLATNVGKYLAEPAIREVQYLLCVNNVINDLENEKEALTSERDNVLTRIAQAKERTEVIEKPVEKWLNDVENLLREVEVLVQRTETDNNCFQGWLPTCGRYLLCKQMVVKIEAMGKFKGKSNIHPFSHLAPLPGIQYNSSEDFIHFGSRQKAYSQLWEALEDDSISIIGVHGMGGCGKTTLVTEVGKKAEKLKMFDKVISFTASQTPNIRGIQGRIADMMNFELKGETEDTRAQRLWLRLKNEKRILLIVDLWREFDLKKVGILLDDDIKKTWKILITTRHARVCTSMDCQKKIHLEILSEDESWNLFQKFARIDDEQSKVLDDVPRKICNECMGLPIAIKIVGSLFKERKEIEWQQAFQKLRDSKASDDEDNATFCLKLSYDYLPTQKAQQIFLLCALFPEEYHIPTEDLVRYALGLGVREILSLQSMRSSINADVNKLLESCLLTRGSVKMHNMVRDAALWIANRSDNCKILVNVDKPLSTVAEDNIRDCFALSSWWFNENPSFCKLHAPNLKMLLVNISAHSSLNSLDLSNLTFEGIQGLEVFSLTVNYRIEVLSFPSSIQLLTNVRTLRLNGFDFGDISFIASLTRLEVLDLRRCYFKELPIEIGKLESLKLLDLSESNIYGDNYKGEIGKCSQLEELYASKCYPLGYVREIILDIGIHLNLQRFVVGEPIIPESTRALQVYDFNISKLRASNKNILQIAETISLSSLLGGCKSIVPDMVGVVGGMNNLSTLDLKYCKEIEYIFDTTYDLKEDDLIPMLVELHLKCMDNLTELCHGPPQQVLHYFEKLELLYIDCCRDLHIIFPSECKLQNLKILNLYYCKTDEVLFSEAVAQSLQQLEQLTIKGCKELKHIIASSGSEEIIPAPMNSHFLMCKLRDIYIFNCKSLESIFPICYVEGLVQLQNMSIEMVPKLEYVFGECDYEHHSSYQYKNHVMLPHLETLNLISLYILIGMCPENCQAMWSSQSLRILDIKRCPKLGIPWFNLKVGYEKSQHHLNEIWRLQCLQSLKLAGCEELKCLFSMERHRSLPELMHLHVSNCQELEQIVAPNEELVELPNAELLYFPKLKQIEVEHCRKLKSLFPLSMVTMLPQLSTLHLSNATQLQEVFRHSQGDGVMIELEIVLPNLTEMTLANLPNFVDICHGSKLHAIKLQRLIISNCLKTDSSLRIIEWKLMKEAAPEDDKDSLYQYPTSRKHGKKKSLRRLEKRQSPF